MIFGILYWMSMGAMILALCLEAWANLYRKKLTKESYNLAINISSWTFRVIMLPIAIIIIMAFMS